MHGLDPYNLGAERAALPAHRRGHGGRYRSRPAGARAAIADAAGAGKGARHRPHHGDTRLYRGAAPRHHGSPGRPGFVRVGDQRAPRGRSAASRRDRPLDERAAAAARSAARRAHHRRDGSHPRAIGPDGASQLPAARRQRTRARGRGAMDARTRAACACRQARDLSRRADDPVQPARTSCAARRRRADGGPHLPRHQGRRRAARRQARRRRHG